MYNVMYKKLRKRENENYDLLFNHQPTTQPQNEFLFASNQICLDLHFNF